MKKSEIWKPVFYKGVDYTGMYEVSNRGSVRSLERMSEKGERVLKAHIKKLSRNKHRYLKVGLTKNGKTKIFNVHALVVSSFLRDIKNGECVDHVNSNRADNRLENLTIVTHRYNISKERAIATGLPTGVFRYKNRYYCKFGLYSDGITSIGLGAYDTIEDARQAHCLALKVSLNTNKDKTKITQKINKYRKSLGLNHLLKRKKQKRLK